MKVFRMSEYEWWAAASKEEAIADYKATTGEDMDPDEDYPQEIDDADLDTMMIAEVDSDENPTGEKVSFRTYLAEFSEAGFFAGTDW